MAHYRRGAMLPIIAFLTACGAETATAPEGTAIRQIATATHVVGATAIPVATPTVRATRTPVPTIAATAAPTVPLASAEQSDLPQLALSSENAPPTPSEGAAVPATASQPVRLIIPDINFDLQTVAVGVDARQIPIVPKHEPGWFTSSARPGQSTNIVFWGHVLRWQDSPTVRAPFEQIEKLKPGAAIEVVTADGTTWRYQVTQQIQARPEDVHFIAPTLTERVTLVSCIGDKVIRDGTLTKAFRLVTIAEPVR